MTDFELFKQEFQKYQKLFGLEGYNVYILKKPLDGAFADTKVRYPDMSAVVRFNSKLYKDDKNEQDIKADAKHEAVHLLVGKLVEAGRHRFTGDDEIYAVTEELVNKLVVLLPSV